MITSKIEDIQEQNFSFISKVKYVLVSILFAYIAVVLFKIFIDYISQCFDFNVNIEKRSEKKNLLKLFLLTIIIAPIIEELIFRLHLKGKKINFAISLFLILFIVVSLYFQDRSNIVNLLFYSIYFVYLIIFMNITDKNFFHERTFFFKTHLILNSVFFALFHITNFEIGNYSEIYVYVINVMPMFIFGYYFSKIRLNLNIYWAIFAHMLSNAIPFLLIFLRK